MTTDNIFHDELITRESLFAYVIELLQADRTSNSALSEHTNFDRLLQPNLTDSHKLCTAMLWHFEYINANREPWIVQRIGSLAAECLWFNPGEGERVYAALKRALEQDTVIGSIQDCLAYRTICMWHLRPGRPQLPRQIEERRRDNEAYEKSDRAAGLLLSDQDTHEKIKVACEFVRGGLAKQTLLDLISQLPDRDDLKTLQSNLLAALERPEVAKGRGVPAGQAAARVFTNLGLVKKGVEA